MQSNQTSSQPIGFFAAHGLCPAKSVKTTGYVLLPGCRSRNALTSAKSLMPLTIAQSHQFYLLSSEAFLLTICIQESF
jgi:hypothetical protein